MPALFCIRLYAAGGRHYASASGRRTPDKRQIAVILIVIQTVSDDEFVGDFKAPVIGCYVCLAPFRLVQQRGDADGFRLPSEQQFLEIGERGAAVENILHQQQVVIFDRTLEVKDDSHLSGGDGRGAIGRDSDIKLDFCVDVQLAASGRAIKTIEPLRTPTSRSCLSL